MREILTQTDFNKMILQDKAVLSFYHDWSKYSAVYGIQYFKEADNFFHNQKAGSKINFWLADVSGGNSPAFFLRDWMENNFVESNLIVIWLNF